VETAREAHLGIYPHNNSHMERGFFLRKLGNSFIKRK
jgi:hypothetical protein